MTQTDARQIALLAGGGSALLLGAAFAFQVAGYLPCELCILQRWPHLIAALIGLAIWQMGSRRVLLWLGLFAGIAATALAIYHSGVEWRLWEGPSACTGGIGNLASMSPKDLMAQLQQAPVVRCDEPAFKFMGATMANMNAAASLVLTFIWVAALRKAGRA